MKYRFGKFVTAFLILHTAIVSQTGGDFSITQSVIGGGSQSISGGDFTVSSTVGQTVAGTNSTGGVFNLQSGFWTSQFAPTAAGVSISGRVSIAGAGNRGIRNARLTLINMTTGEIRTAQSGSYGIFRFDDLSAAQTYILTVTAQRFSFAENTRVITPMEDLTDEDFAGDEQF